VRVSLVSEWLSVPVRSCSVVGRRRCSGWAAGARIGGDGGGDGTAGVCQGAGAEWRRQRD
jgi:hypothetical protein